MNRTNTARICSQGKVTALEGDMARVEVSRNAMCDSCHQQSSCNVNMLDSSRDSMATVRNPLGAKPGNKVEIAIDEAVLVRGSAVLYILPLVFMLLGLLLAMALKDRISLGMGEDMLALVAALVGLVVSLPVVRAWSSRSRYLAANVPVITRILEQEEDV
jgi:sigma-E factor negative regulatory protein RseC